MKKPKKLYRWDIIVQTKDGNTVTTYFDKKEAEVVLELLEDADVREWFEYESEE